MHLFLLFLKLNDIMKDVLGHKILNFLKILILPIFFIGFPFISYYYLKTGFNYQLSVIEEIAVKDSTSLDVLAVFDAERRELLEQKVIITCLTQDQESLENFLKLFRDSQKQFGDRNDLLFVVYANNFDSMERFSERVAALRRPEEVMTVEVDAEQYANLRKELKVADSDNLVLIDVESKIRNYYNYNNKEDLAKLGGHIVKVFPFIKSPEFEYKPSPEK
jgi:hypothetical protein